MWLIVGQEAEMNKMNQTLGAENQCILVYSNCLGGVLYCGGFTHTHIRTPNFNSVVVSVGCSRAFQLRMLSERRASVFHYLPKKCPLHFGEFSDLPVCITEFLKLFCLFHLTMLPIFYFHVQVSSLCASSTLSLHLSWKCQRHTHTNTHTCVYIRTYWAQRKKIHPNRK